MIYRKLDSNGDYSFGYGKLDFLSGVESVAQAIITRIKFLQGDWWENLLDGTPLWQQMLGAKGDDLSLQLIDNILVKRISTTKGVNSIESYESSFNRETRSYSFQAVVNTEFGQLSLEEEV